MFQGRKWLPKTWGQVVMRLSDAAGGAFYSVKKSQTLHLRPCVQATTKNFSGHTRTMPCSV